MASMFTHVFLALVCQTAWGVLPPAVAKYQKDIGDALAARHPIRIVWKGQAYGVSGTQEEEISGKRLRQHMSLPDIPLEDTLVLEGGRVIDKDTNGRVRVLAGNTRATALTTYAILSGSWLGGDGRFESLPDDDQGRARVRWLPQHGATAEITFDKEGALAEIAVDQGGGQ
jgi:hypothetical protein